MDNISSTSDIKNKRVSKKERQRKSHLIFDKMEALMRANKREMIEFRLAKKEGSLESLYSDLQVLSEYKAAADNDYAAAFEKCLFYKQKYGKDADKDYISILEKMKVNNMDRIKGLQKEEERNCQNEIYCPIS